MSDDLDPVEERIRALSGLMERIDLWKAIQCIHLAGYVINDKPATKPPPSPRSAVVGRTERERDHEPSPPPDAA